MKTKQVRVVRFIDGRKAILWKKIPKGFEIIPTDDATFKPGEMVELTGHTQDGPCTARFIVGGRCGPKKDRFRIRHEGFVE